MEKFYVVLCFRILKNFDIAINFFMNTFLIEVSVQWSWESGVETHFPGSRMKLCEMLEIMVFETLGSSDDFIFKIMYFNNADCILF